MDGITTAKRRVPEATNIASTRSRFGVALESVSVSAVTNRTVYDALGRVIASIDGRGNATRTEYDPLGLRAVSFDGAGNPTRYAYDRFGNLAAVTNALGHATVYEYDLRGRNTYEGGATYPVRYTYDVFGNKTTMMTYRDESLGYDAMGRQREASDAAGVTTFAYDDFGSLTNETVIGVAGTNVIERFYDAYGRSLGYSLNGERRTTLLYEPDKGRISSMLAAGSTNEFRWSYLPGSDLKETLVYPNGDVVLWEYESKRDLLTLVSNSMHSTYRYTYDAAGRRVSKNDEQYGYNVRNELILATNIVTGAEFAYCYDDIGNRLWSREFGTNTTYAANCLNQYTNILRGGVVEHPAFDVDGNQTDITTSTGRWLVEYNGENRPVRWTRPADGTAIEMSYDRMGRRVCSGSETFVYDGYLNIVNTIWDPTEPVATRPLVRLSGDDNLYYYFHDGNKNVTDIVDGISKHYDYSPFGVMGSVIMAVMNPWCFSSEHFDQATDATYYNYRYYDMRTGRWSGRDPIEEFGGINVYGFTAPIFATDALGLKKCRSNSQRSGYEPTVNGCGAKGGASYPNSYFGLVDFTSCCNDHDRCYGTCASDKGACDSGLEDCMSNACDRYFTLPIAWHERAACKAMAWVYGLAVSLGGGDAYESAQDEACDEDCCDD